MSQQLFARILRRPASGPARLYEPTARSGHCAALLKGKVFMWAGRTANFDRVKESLAAQVETFDLFTETWSQQHTTGDPPPGLYNGCCATCAGLLYHYGGSNGRKHYSSLSKFDPASLNWTLVGKDSINGPMRKANCAMVCFGEVLWVFAGYGQPTRPIQHGSAFSEDQSGSARTNELHSFHTRTGVWSSPAVSGERPSPRNACTLTALDNHRAMAFAGRSKEGRLNDTFILDVHRMSFSELKLLEGGPVPVARAGHAACCLNYGSPTPQLLISGGKDNYGTILSDSWILDVVSRRWWEVDLPHGSQPRADHSLTAITLGEGLTETVSFGGYYKYPENAKTAADLDPYHIAETTLMRFESPPSSASTKWSLTDTSTNSKRGSQERILAKKVKIAELHKTGAPATSPSHQPHPSPRETQALQASQERERVLEQRAQEAERREQEAQRRLRDAEQRAQEAEGRLQEAEDLTHQFQQLAEASEQRERQANERAQQCETQMRQSQQRVQQLEARLERKSQENESLETQWVVQRNEIDLTREELGRGGWAAVKVAVFRGTRVAAKCFFQQIVSPYNRRLFRREMNMASRIRHPNLVQFVGATLEGEMIILTELMPTSLRAVLEQRAISHDEITSISLDVARALNYLHLMQPDPVVHRDISSANVLLELGLNNSWKAKVSDYGSVNQLQSLQTTGAGNPTYAAPEANTRDQQTPKMDIFSFGVLLIEMCTDQFPELNEREEQIESITDPRFLAVVKRCLDEAKDKRPTAAELIAEFQQ